MFEWCDEFDDIINDWHSDYDSENHTFLNVIDYTNNFKKNDFYTKYDYLSTYMSCKADQIREEKTFKSKNQYLRKQSTKERENSPRWKYSKWEEEKRKGNHKMMKSVSYDPRRILNMTSLVGANNSIKSKSKDSFKSSSKRKSNDYCSDLIGYIDPFGLFKLNLHQNEIFLQSTDMTQNIGFFDKLSFDSSLKDWHNDMKKSFKIHKDIFERAILWNESRSRFLYSRVLNWSYFDNMHDYIIDEKELTWYNKPIFI